MPGIPEEILLAIARLVYDYREDPRSLDPAGILGFGLEVLGTVVNLKHPGAVTSPRDPTRVRHIIIGSFNSPNFGGWSLDRVGFSWGREWKRLVDVVSPALNLAFLSLGENDLDRHFFEWSAGLRRPINVFLDNCHLDATFFPPKESRLKLQFSSVSLQNVTSYCHSSTLTNMSFLQLCSVDLERAALDIDAALDSSWGTQDQPEEFFLPRSIEYLSMNVAGGLYYDYVAYAMTYVAVEMIQSCGQLKWLGLRSFDLHYDGETKISIPIAKATGPLSFLSMISADECEIGELTISTPITISVRALDYGLLGVRTVRVRVDVGEPGRLQSLLRQFTVLTELVVDWVNSEEMVENLVFPFSTIKRMRFNELGVKSVDPVLMKAKIEENKERTELTQFWLNGRLGWVDLGSHKTYLPPMPAYGGARDPEEMRDDGVLHFSLTSRQFHQVSLDVLGSVVQFSEPGVELELEEKGKVRHVVVGRPHTGELSSALATNFDTGKLFSSVLVDCDRISTLSLYDVRLGGEFLEWAVALPRTIWANLVRCRIDESFFPHAGDRRELQFHALKLEGLRGLSVDGVVANSVTVSLRILHLALGGLLRLDLTVDGRVLFLAAGAGLYRLFHQVPKSVKFLALTYTKEDPIWGLGRGSVDSGVMIANSCRWLEELVVKGPSGSYQSDVMVQMEINKAEVPFAFVNCLRHSWCNVRELTISTPITDRWDSLDDGYGSFANIVKVCMKGGGDERAGRLREFIGYSALQELVVDWEDGSEMSDNVICGDYPIRLKFNELGERTVDANLLLAKIEENKGSIGLREFWLNGYKIWDRYQRIYSSM
ncbi:hypothetical protein FB446DRAFT_709591 [Lentinula raphanica]|nr:hypothetical protein FB446DRAFT_709591 [Lentinula raphanica]